MAKSGQSRRLRRFVAGVCIIGVGAVIAVASISRSRWRGDVPLVHSSYAAAVAFIVLTVLGQLLYVKVRHGSTTEELNFFEVALAAGILVLAPETVLVTILVGVLVGELVIRRPMIKAAFNLGMYAASTAAMVLTYHLLFEKVLGDPTSSPLSLASMVSLILASMVFTAINLGILAGLLHVTVGAGIREVLSEEWRLSGFMAVGSVGVGSVVVALVMQGLWAVLPFAFLPALALWYAYMASAQHAEAQERNKYLVALGGALAQHGQDPSAREVAITAVRNIVAAEHVRLIDPATQPAERDMRILGLIESDAGPVVLDGASLPGRWATGIAMRLDLGGDEPGALLLGSSEPVRQIRITGRTRGWEVAPADIPVLGALVAAVGSSMRAGSAFATMTEERDKLTAVVDNTSDGIAMVDETGGVLLWSQTMARMTGVGAPELVDPKTFPEIVSTLVATTSQAGARVGAQQLALQRADGEVLDVSVTTARVRAAAGSDGEQGWVQVLTVHDETRERRVERMKTDFVATVSHELRTPITPIKGYAKLLATRRDRMSPEKVTEKLQVIASSADHLERLVDDLLMAQRVSGRANLRVEMGVADLADVIRASVDGFPALMEKIRVELPPESISVQCDRERAVQCLANLIGNAVKYAPGELIEVTTRAKGLQVQVVVRDHGAGIPQAEHERVFERFYRREDPFTMRTGGAGLGLHISRELSVAMGGGLTLEQPEEGTGCAFVLHLLTTAAPPHNQPSTTDSAGATPASPPAPRQHDTMSLEGAPEGAQ